MNTPNVLSISRGFCAPFFLWATWTEHWIVAFALAVYAVVSDLIDGPIARRLEQATELGTRVDHTADFVFVFFGFVGLSLQDGTLVPLALPVLQFCAFFEYAYTGPQAHSSLLPSRLGKFNGVAYFVVVVAVPTQSAFELDWIPTLFIYGFCWVLVTSTVVSMAIRLSTRIRNRRDVD